MASASLVKHGKKWRVVWREGGRGSKRHASEGYKLKSDAEAERERILDRLRSQQPVGLRTLVPIAEVLTRWIASVRTEKHATETYLRKSQRTLERLITAKGWEKTADATRESVSGVKRGELRLLRAMLTHAQTYDQAVDRHVWDLPMPPRPDHPKVDLLTEKQAKALCAEAARWSPANGVLAHLLVTYGHRPESLAAAVVGDVDARASTIELPVKSIGKTRRVRHPILAETLAQLRPLVKGRDPAAPLFISHLGKPWGTGQAIAQWWYDSVGREVLGKRSRACGVYQLKRYAISRMLNLGLDVATIASLTGHARPEQLLIYARTNEERQKVALEALAGAGVTQVSTKQKKKVAKEAVKADKGQ